MNVLVQVDKNINNLSGVNEYMIVKSTGVLMITLIGNLFNITHSIVVQTWHSTVIQAVPARVQACDRISLTYLMKGRA